MPIVAPNGGVVKSGAPTWFYWADYVSPPLLSALIRVDPVTILGLSNMPQYTADF